MGIFRMLLVGLVLTLVWSGHAVDRHTSTLVATAAHADDGVAGALLMPQDAGSGSETAPGGPTTQATEGGAADPVGLLLADPGALSSALLSAWPGPHVGPDWIAPYLDGPQRPPRALHALA